MIETDREEFYHFLATVAESRILTLERRWGPERWGVGGRGYFAHQRDHSRCQSPWFPTRLTEWTPVLLQQPKGSHSSWETPSLRVDKPAPGHFHQPPQGTYTAGGHLAPGVSSVNEALTLAVNLLSNLKASAGRIPFSLGEVSLFLKAFSSLNEAHPDRGWSAALLRGHPFNCNMHPVASD